MKCGPRTFSLRSVKGQRGQGQWSAAAGFYHKSKCLLDKMQLFFLIASSLGTGGGAKVLYVFFAKLCVFRAAILPLPFVSVPLRNGGMRFPQKE